MDDWFVIKHIGCSDPTPYAVAKHIRDLNGRYTGQLKIEDWYEKENDARAYAHRYNNPEY